MPQQNDSIRLNLSNFVGFNANQTGVNYEWDYSNLVANSEDLLYYRSSFNTPYAFYFLNLNTFGMQVSNGLELGTFRFEDVYNFFFINNNEFSANGIGFKFQGIPLAALYSNRDEIYRFPLQFGNRDSTTFSVSLNLPSIGVYKSSGYRLNTVDGWGKLKIPNGSFDVIRVKTLIFSNDSILADLNGFPLRFGFPNIREEIKWLAKGEKAPILQLDGRTIGGNFTPTRVAFKKIPKPGEINNNPNKVYDQFKLIANPIIDNQLLVGIPKSSLGNELKLFNLNGQLIASWQINTAGTNVYKLPILSSGIYLLQTANEHTQKVLIQ